MNRSLVSFLFVFLFFLFLTPLASASPPPSGIVCVQGKVVDCTAGNCSGNDTTMDKSQDCDLEELEKAQRQLKRGLEGMKPALEELRASSRDGMKRLEAVDAILAQLPKDIIGRGEIIILLEELLQSPKYDLDVKIEHLLGFMTERNALVEERIADLEGRVGHAEQRLARIQLGLGGAAVVSIDGMYYGAGFNIYLPIGKDGDWTVAGGGFVGGSSVAGSSGFGYGANLSATHMVAEGFDWDLSIGPAAVAAFDAGSGYVGFRAFTAGGGLEAQFTSGWAKMSVTPFIGAGGIKDGSAGGDITFTGGALLRMEFTPF